MGEILVSPLLSFAESRFTQQLWKISRFCQGYRIPHTHLQRTIVTQESAADTELSPALPPVLSSGDLPSQVATCVPTTASRCWPFSVLCDTRSGLQSPVRAGSVSTDQVTDKTKAMLQGKDVVKQLDALRNAPKLLLEISILAVYGRLKVRPDKYISFMSFWQDSV